MADGYRKNSLYVKNLSPQVTEGILREIFEPHDRIEKITFRAYPGANNQFFAQMDFASSTGVAEGSKLTGTAILGVACSCTVVDPIASQKQLDIAAAQQSDLPEQQDNPDLQLEIFNKQLKEEAEDQRLRTIHIAGFAGPVSESAVRRLCANFGDVIGARVGQDVNGATFALVEFAERGVAHVVKMQKAFKVDSSTLVFSEAKSMVDDIESIEKGVQFQAPVLDAINMGTVLQMQGLLNEKLQKVKSAAQELEAAATKEEGAAAAAGSPTAEAEGSAAETPATEGEAAPTPAEEGKKKAKEKKKRKAKEGEKENDSAADAASKRKRRKKKMTKEQKKKAKKKKKKEKEKKKQQRKEAKKAMMQEQRKQVASAAAALRSDDVQARFDACIAMRRLGALLAARHVDAIETVLEDDDVDVREAAMETIRILGEAGALQVAKRRKDDSSDKDEDESEDASTAAEIESSGSGPVDLDEVEMMEGTELYVLGDEGSSSISLSSDVSSDDSSVLAPLILSQPIPRTSPLGAGRGRGLGARKLVAGRGRGVPRILRGSIELDVVGAIAVAMDSDDESPL